MNVEWFLELLVKELEQNDELKNYYKLIDSKSFFLFRKAYIEQRLNFVFKTTGKGNLEIWDVGCGYATSAILLTLIGHKVRGSTLEFYYDKIQKRLEYWSKYGDLSKLTFKYENIFDIEIATEKYDAILVQDTLHHIEPIHDALRIFHNALKKDGRIISSEENGRNFFCAAKHFKERGFKRIIEIYDEKLNKKLFFGNENTRSFSKWEKIFTDNNFIIDEESVEFIRFFPPFVFKEYNYRNILNAEQRIWRKNCLLREYLFFGINFVARKQAI
jgi:SAM-dependent methyltransferase